MGLRSSNFRDCGQGLFVGPFRSLRFFFLLSSRFVNLIPMDWVLFSIRRFLFLNYV